VAQICHTRQILSFFLPHPVETTRIRRLTSSSHGEGGWNFVLPQLFCRIRSLADTFPSTFWKPQTFVFCRLQCTYCRTPVLFCRVGHLSRNFYGPNSQIKHFVQKLPDAALFFGLYVQNLADTFPFLPDSHKFVESLSGGCTFFAAFGKKHERLKRYLPHSAIFSLSSGTLSPLSAQKMKVSVVFCGMRHFLCLTRLKKYTLIAKTSAGSGYLWRIGEKIAGSGKKIQQSTNFRAYHHRVELINAASGKKISFSQSLFVNLLVCEAKLVDTEVFICKTEHFHAVLSCLALSCLVLSCLR
jgi:hypothetical protein